MKFLRLTHAKLPNIADGALSLCFLLFICFVGYGQRPSDNSLEAVKASDRMDRTAKAKTVQLSVAEHMRRAGIYLANRAFAAAREHWQAVIDAYPNDSNIPTALYGMARSYYQERRYDDARQLYERVARDYPQTKEGREGLNFSASSLLRMGKGAEAAARYQEYITKYPTGERIDSAHLNVIDGYRDAGNFPAAINWIERTRQKFAGTATETNAIFARLRVDIMAADWDHALQTADELMRKPFLPGVNTSTDELLYLKAHILERAGKTEEATRFYSMIPENSYYGNLATARMAASADPNARRNAAERAKSVHASVVRVDDEYPAPYRFQVVKEAQSRNLDPRLVLAIMKQESQFKPTAKSPSAARGLLQLTIDAAKKYADRAGMKNLSEDALYRPDVSIAVGCEYLSELSRMFAGLPEAIVASYNGGEDNVARWLARTNQRDPGVFAAEVGFTETKNYVFKVMSNYRAYQELYDAKLNRQ
jgi:soluble lytic murein transglycosylase